ncbi:MAG: hypothetical protein PHP01_07085 [Phycisphaerae bacterium]|nr:hypothetical protein [Phycisphaerae bacterium]
MKRKNTGSGKILRVKNGYNPNSSSMGSQIPTFLFFAAGTGAFGIMAAQILNAVRGHIEKKKDSLDTGKQR